MWQESVNALVYGYMGLAKGEPFADALNFFIYDTVKILVLLSIIIFIVTFLRTYFNTEKVRDYLVGKNVWWSHVAASLFGIITPFCSCSAITLFLGFIQARIPMGVTFSFLISAPLNNEIAIAMLFALFGWKITAIYIGFGLFVAIFGGWMIGRFGKEEWILLTPPQGAKGCGIVSRESNFFERLKAAREGVGDIVGKVWLYVVIGIAIGGVIHGYVPADVIVSLAGPENPFGVVVAVMLGVPLYSNAAGVMPLIEVLTSKGMMLGTALAFMMSVTALSLPEAVILKRILDTKLIALFFGIVTSGIIIIGYMFNAIL